MREPDTEHQYAIERRSKPAPHWHRVMMLMLGTDEVGARRELAGWRECEPDAEYRLVRRPACEWEAMDG